MVRNRRKSVLRYFGAVGLIVAAACVGAPVVLEPITPDDARALWSLGGAVGGVGVVLTIGSVFTRGPQT
ncbi:hypothetical protein ACBY01_17080 [Sphingomonas sp. ac-8]|uniref:hypothetical protein n=1 Tax=Sphingomonas sp. ac-8 TaxID=3242977 RepID=UPI003A7FC0F2